MHDRLLMAGAVTLLFAMLARLLRGVSNSGAVAGAFVCFAIYSCAGLGAFVSLVGVFIVTWAATRVGHQQKHKLGVAEKTAGRSASQVLANLSVAAACAIAYGASGRQLFLIGMASALVEAAADTVSSEIGQAGGRAVRLITTWELVPAGTDGGISIQGTAAGIVTAIMVAGVCVSVGLLSWRQGAIAAAAGFLGSIADSYLGALLERRRKINNDLVNLLSTAIAAAIGLLARA
jgi:uncharacterized protein (TIGR00297 family)